MSTRTKDQDEVKIVIKPEVLDLAERIRKDMKLDAKTGVATVSESFYETTLPEGITRETVQALQNHNTAFAAAGLYALGQESVPVMKKHKDLDVTTLEIPTVGKDSFEYNFHRSKQVTNPGNTEAGPKTKFGVGNVGFNMYGAGNRAEVKKVKNLLAEQAAAAFGS